MSVSEVVAGSMLSEVQRIQLDTGINGGKLQEGSILFSLEGKVANIAVAFNASSADMADSIGSMASPYPGAINVSRTDLSGDNSTSFL